MKSIRQGDVLLQLQKVASIPAGAEEIKKDGNRIVLAYGDVTGHAHAIYEDTDNVKIWAIGKVKYLEVMANAMIFAGDQEIIKTPATTELYYESGKPFPKDENDIDYDDPDLKVREITPTVFFPVGTCLPGVLLKHEEHSKALIEPGIYKLPVQVEYTPQELRVSRD